MRNDKENLIADLTVDYAVRSIDFAQQLKRNKQFEIATQLIRCATSVGANVHEAQNAESKADFVHKMKIAAKEASEALFWHEVCNRSSHLPDIAELDGTLLSIVKVLSRIISSSKGRG